MKIVPSYTLNEQQMSLLIRRLQYGELAAQFETKADLLVLDQLRKDMKQNLDTASQKNAAEEARRKADHPQIESTIPALGLHQLD
jgi:hypothetical protein